MSSSQTEYANRLLPPSDSSTVPFNREEDPASQLLNKLEQLTGKVDQAANLGLAATMPVPSSQPAPFQPATNNPDDECLDAYLQKYMQRLTGKASVETAPAPAAASIPAVKSAPPEPAAEERVRQPTQAPERRDQINAMRDLAIDSARRAVSESCQIQRIITARRSYLQAKVASLASIVVAIGYFVTHAPFALTGSLLLFAVAVLLSVRFALLFRSATAETT